MAEEIKQDMAGRHRTVNTKKQPGTELKQNFPITTVATSSYCWKIRRSGNILVLATIHVENTEQIRETAFFVFFIFRLHIYMERKIIQKLVAFFVLFLFLRHVLSI